MKHTSLRVFVAIYNEASLYPPTISMVHLLAEKYGEIHLLDVTHRDHQGVSFPSNVIHHRVIRKPETRASRIMTMVSFLSAFRKVIRKYDPSIVLVYDPVATFPMYLFRSVANGKRFCWYHNHDIIDEKRRRGLSFLKIAYSIERKNIRNLHLFTIPSVERLACYGELQHHKSIFVLPNYPSSVFFASMALPDAPAEDLRLIYQGNISEGHGFEEIISWLPLQIAGKPVKLFLIGFIREEYQKKLETLLREKGVSSFVTIAGKVPFSQLAEITRQHHVGLAIYTRNDIMNSTLGTASNKIYEYTATGMPFLYFINEHFDYYLKDMDWAFGTDLTLQSFVSCLEEMVAQYSVVSLKAKRAFFEKYSYEKAAEPIWEKIDAFFEKSAPVK